MQEILKKLETLKTTEIEEIRDFFQRAADWQGAKYSEFLEQFPQAIADSDNKLELIKKLVELKITWDSFEEEWQGAPKEPAKRGYQPSYKHFTEFNILGFSNIANSIYSKLRTHSELKDIMQQSEKLVAEEHKRKLAEKEEKESLSKEKKKEKSDQKAIHEKKKGLDKEKEEDEKTLKEKPQVGKDRIQVIVKGMESRAQLPMISAQDKLNDTKFGMEALIKEASSLSELQQLLTILKNKSSLKHLHAETKVLGQTTLHFLMEQIQYKAHQLLLERVKDGNVTDNEWQIGADIAKTKIGVTLFESKHAKDFADLKKQYDSMLENSFKTEPPHQ
ncbi:hypothetical protein ACQUW5_06650 [Legionella sp. CNM-1927-20]|uniref:hypothetical protein n=1 Tax=Legionella sp. CNM-1927-20 TaxID=3422221 RepID=UPI00403B1EB0